jgi:putative addiction module component (TIGR02574 family)
MTVPIDPIGIERLSVRDRLDLIEQIWNSLPEQVEPHDIPEWHLAELNDRRAQAAKEPGAGKPWREVLQRIENGT